MLTNLEGNTVLSVVVPMYNEEGNIDAFYARVTAALEQTGETWEIICINDGSRDATLALLVALHQKDPRVKVINLSRNFGKEVALTAGIDCSIGQAVIPIDADLQDPPELIHELVTQWRAGHDIVNATRRTRHGESWLKRASAWMFYKILGGVAGFQVPHNTGDFRLLSRPVVEALKRLPERTRFMKGLFAWVGFRQTAVFYDRHARFTGKSKWNYWQLWNFAIDGITSFSSAPLKVSSCLGLLIAFMAFIYALFLVVRTVIYGIDVPGYASLMVVVLFLGSVQLISLGVIGEYIGRLYAETKGRPLYIVRDYYGINPDTKSMKDPA